MCGQNVELLNVKLAVHIVTSGLNRSGTFDRWWSAVNWESSMTSACQGLSAMQSAADWLFGTSVVPIIFLTFPQSF